jgi:hypothetical protein
VAAGWGPQLKRKPLGSRLTRACMTNTDRTVLWQERAPHDKAAVIHHGLERAWDRSIPELLSSARAVTLMTRTGAEVQVGNLHPIAVDWWEADVLRVGPPAGALAPGKRIGFGSAHVFGATL